MKRTCSCGREYRSFNPFRALCRTCEQDGRGRELVSLGFAQDELEANIWRDLLEQQGIPSATRQHDPIRARFQSAPLPFSVEVVVMAQDYDRAREAIEGEGEDLTSDLHDGRHQQLR